MVTGIILHSQDFLPLIEPGFEFTSKDSGIAIAMEENVSDNSEVSFLINLIYFQVYNLFAWD